MARERNIDRDAIRLSGSTRPSYSKSPRAWRSLLFNTQKFGDEFLVSETKRAIVVVLQVAARLSTSIEIDAFVATCIRLASTDLFAA
jgi:hypothetical protein